jgi:hypothetical protein
VVPWPNAPRSAAEGWRPFGKLLAQGYSVKNSGYLLRGRDCPLAGRGMPIGPLLPGLRCWLHSTHEDPPLSPLSKITLSHICLDLSRQRGVLRLRPNPGEQICGRIQQTAGASRRTLPPRLVAHAGRASIAHRAPRTRPQFAAGDVSAGRLAQQAGAVEHVVRGNQRTATPGAPGAGGVLQTLGRQDRGDGPGQQGLSAQGGGSSAARRSTKLTISGEVSRERASPPLPGQPRTCRPPARS